MSNQAEPLTVNVTGVSQHAAQHNAPQAGPTVLDLRDVSVFYGNYEAVRGTPAYFCFYLTQSPGVLKSPVMLLYNIEKK